MLNMLRSDLYRILHIRSFKIGVFIMSIMTICLTMPSVNVMSNTAFANYDAQIGDFAEYLYYFPKSAIFMIIVMLMYVIYLNEEYTSGFIKNVYPYLTDKLKLSISRLLIFVIYYIVFSFINIIFSLITVGFIQGRFGTISIIDYIIYYVIQLLLATAVGSFLELFIHLSKKNIVSTILIFLYTFGVLFGMVYIFFQEWFNLSVYENAIYYLSGTLPYRISDVYLNTMIVGIFALGIGVLLNMVILKKKDLE